MVKYHTVFNNAMVEQVIDKSRFIGHIKPVETKEDADLFIKEIKSQYKDATHNVPAMVVGEKMEVQWASDDGEPQGTSGAPIVQMLVKKNITNVAIVITRYFGGIKLGTGGLVRAYTGTASQAVEAAGIAEVKQMLEIKVGFDYTFLGKIENLAHSGAFLIKDIQYQDSVNASFVIDVDKADAIKKDIINITSGTLKMLSELNIYEKERIQL